jgi:hypothetical protein
MEQKYDPENIKVLNIPGNGTVTVRWIIQNGEKYQVNVDSKKGGIASRTK